MADDKNITQVNAASAVQATDLIPVAQGDARLKRATVQQVADFVQENFAIPNGGLNYIPQKNSDVIYVSGGTDGWFADYDCKAARVLTIRQAENQSAQSGGGFRDAILIHHADEDPADYTLIGQKISTAIRCAVTGLITGGDFALQYKDLVGGDFAAIGRIDWLDRGVSGIVTSAIQHGRGIASNEFAVENPALAPEQSVSMAAVQAIVRQRKAPCDSTHKARGVLITNEGHEITAGIDLLSLGGLGGRYTRGIDMIGAWVSNAAIRMPNTGGTGPAHAGTIIEYDVNDYTMYDRGANAYVTVIGGTNITRVTANGLALLGAFDDVAALALPASTASRASLYLTPGGSAPSSPINGQMWFDGGALRFRIGDLTRVIAFV